MKSITPKLIQQNPDIVAIFVGTALILAIPVVAMQFIPDWDWDIFDFMTIGCLLSFSGLVFALTARKIKKAKLKVALALIVALTVALVWVEMAVGIFD
jgi:peptidoglycan/LPS O-acetylase OafA/YrhL